LKKVKQLAQQIHRTAAKKGPNYQSPVKPLYQELLQKTQLVTQRARERCVLIGQPSPSPLDLFGANTLQADSHNRVQRLSLDRGFHCPENHTQLSKMVDTLCLPKPGTKQSAAQHREADEEFLAAQQNHPGIESAIGALQRANALKRCRDRSEVGCERYLQLAILGRNLHTLGRMLIAREEHDAAAGQTRRKAAEANS
jgi:hypothetical protein